MRRYKPFGGCQTGPTMPIIGKDGIFIGMTGFGASAPYKDVYNYFKFTQKPSPRLQCGVATVDAC